MSYFINPSGKTILLFLREIDCNPASENIHQKVFCLVVFMLSHGYVIGHISLKTNNFVNGILRYSVTPQYVRVSSHRITEKVYTNLSHARTNIDHEIYFLVQQDKYLFAEKLNSLSRLNIINPFLIE